jgi:hypothetical protein
MSRGKDASYARGPYAALIWFATHYDLARRVSCKSRMGAVVSAITKLANSRSTYGNWAGREAQP